MIVKLLLHYMPWEIDYALLNFTQFKRSSDYIPADIKIRTHCVLNTSDYIIDWKNSKLPKEFFIEKFNSLKPLMEWSDIERYEVVETDKRYGHLNMHRESYSDDVDGYIIMCPDSSFGKYLLPMVVQNARYIENDYFILSPEIYKMWDYTWDCITSEKYMDVDYTQWDKADVFKLENDSTDAAGQAELRMAKNFKFAGWFDYFNKGFMNKLLRVPTEWEGYGPWDLYCLIILNQIKMQRLPIDVEQYLLKSQIVYSYHSGDLKTDKIAGFAGYYKKMLSLKPIENQRAIIENYMPKYVTRWMEEYKKGKII